MSLATSATEPVPNPRLLRHTILRLRLPHGRRTQQLRGRISTNVFLLDFGGEHSSSAQSVPVVNHPHSPSSLSDRVPVQLHRHHFRLGEKLGDGGQGTVFRAEWRWARTHRHGPRVVALKVCSVPMFSRTSILPVQRELEAHEAASGHENVTVLYGGFRHLNRFFFAMELLPGGDLFDAIAQYRGTMSRTVVLEVVLQIARALHHSHSNGVAHCDVKPENILLTAPFRVEGGNTFKLADFGMAQMFEAPPVGPPLLTRHGGTAYYKPLETLQHEPHDPTKTDIYALGVTLFELITGEWPFPVAFRHMYSEKAHVQARQGPVQFAGGSWAGADMRIKRLVRVLLDRDWRRRPTASRVVEMASDLLRGS